MIPGASCMMGGGATPPYYSDLALWAEYEGANNATSAVDWSPTPKTINFFGNAKLTTSQFKTGASCLALDGSGDYNTFGVAADWKFLHDCTIPWTIEGWMKLNTFAGSPGLFSTTVTSAGVGLMFYVNSSRQIVAGIFRGALGTSVCGLTTGAAVQNDGAWHPFALQYDHSLGSANMRAMVDGLTAGTANKSGNSPSTANPTNTLHVGAYAGETGSGNLNGWLDGLVITRGRCLYTPPYTPRTYI